MPEIFEPQTIPAAVLKMLKATGGNERVVGEDYETSMAKVIAGAVELAQVLDENKNDPFKRAAILLPNDPLFDSAFLGCLFAGWTPVPLNLVLEPDDLAATIRKSRTGILITKSTMRKKADGIFCELKAKITIILIDELVPDLNALNIDTIDLTPIKKRVTKIQPDDTAVILFTSGTEGANKGVMLTHRNLLSNARSCAQVRDFAPGDRILCILPKFHTYAVLMCLVIPYTIGASVFMRKRFSSEAIIRLIEHESLTHVLLVPSMATVLARSRSISTTDLSSVKIFLSGGGIVTEQLRNDFRNAIGHELINGYGLTEASPTVASNRPGDVRPGSVGKPIPDVEVEIWGDDDKPLPAGEVGEVHVRGLNVMKGYLDDPEATRHVITPTNWLRTGDLGRLDEDGYLYITGRKKELIISSGINIHPSEIEHVIDSHPKIAESAVVGLLDAIRGEVPVAYAVIAGGHYPSEDEIRSHCHAHLPSYMVPRKVHFVKTLPRTATGKIQKSRLLD